MCPQHRANGSVVADIESTCCSACGDVAQIWCVCEKVAYCTQCKVNHKKIRHSQRCEFRKPKKAKKLSEATKAQQLLAPSNGSSNDYGSNATANAPPNHNTVHVPGESVGTTDDEDEDVGCHSNNRLTHPPTTATERPYSQQWNADALELSAADGAHTRAYICISDSDDGTYVHPHSPPPPLLTAAVKMSRRDALERYVGVRPGAVGEGRHECKGVGTDELVNNGGDSPVAVIPTIRRSKARYMTSATHLNVHKPNVIPTINRSRARYKHGTVRHIRLSVCSETCTREDSCPKHQGAHGHQHQSVLESVGDGAASVSDGKVCIPRVPPRSTTSKSVIDVTSVDEGYAHADTADVCQSSIDDTYQLTTRTQHSTTDTAAAGTGDYPQVSHSNELQPTEDVCVGDWGADMGFSIGGDDDAAFAKPSETSSPQPTTALSSATVSGVGLFGEQDGAYVESMADTPRTTPPPLVVNVGNAATHAHTQSQDTAASAEDADRLKRPAQGISKVNRSKRQRLGSAPHNAEGTDGGVGGSTEAGDACMVVCTWPGCRTVAADRDELLRHLCEHTDKLWAGCIAPWCKEVCTSNEALERHVRTHYKRTPYVCLWQGCTALFNCVKAVIGHAQAHTGETPFACSWYECDSVAVSSDNLLMHMITHCGLRSFVCTHSGCGGCYADKDALTQHQSTHRRGLDCKWDGCGATLRSDRQLIRHMRVHTGECPYVCTWEGCDQSFAKRKRLAKHLRLHTELPDSAHIKVEPSIPTGAGVCPDNSHGPLSGVGVATVVGESTATTTQTAPVQLQQPQDRTGAPVQQPSSAPEISGGTPVVSGANAHLCAWSGCGVRVTSEKALRRHLTEFHVRVPCPYPNCAHTCYKHEVFKHAQTTHYRDRRTKVYQCAWGSCASKRRPLCAVLKHMRTHIRRVIYSCSWEGCSFNCATLVRIKRHMMRGHQAHSTLLPTATHSHTAHATAGGVCIQQPKRVKATAADSPWRACAFVGCGVTEDNVRLMRKHLCAHVAPPIHCPFGDCGVLLSSELSLERHVRTHISGGVYVCSWIVGWDVEKRETKVCGVRLRGTSNLLLHMRRHTDDSVFRCTWPGCDQSHTLQFDTVQHMMNRHLANISSGFICTVDGCGEEFGSMKERRRHITNKHTPDVKHV